LAIDVPLALALDLRLLPAPTIVVRLAPSVVVVTTIHFDTFGVRDPPFRRVAAGPEDDRADTQAEAYKSISS
jgi:hypothetical protein